MDDRDTTPEVMLGRIALAVIAFWAFVVAGALIACLT
jgi:hypothetical protein